MPIQCNVVQPTGVTATFHEVSEAQQAFNNPASGNCIVVSYLSDPRVTPMASLATQEYDISPLLSAPTQAISASATTTGQTVLSLIEQYLLTLSAFTGGTQVA